MAQRHRASHGSLFLMELIFSILLFTFIATICISGFVKSHAMSRDASLQIHYVTMAGNVAEVLRSGDSFNESIDGLRTHFPDATLVSPSSNVEVNLSETKLGGDQLPALIHIYFDSDFHPCDLANAAYCAEATISVDQDFMTADLGIRVGGNTAHVYDLTVEHFYHTPSGE